ncbi:tRNA glutamyl-Q(34) synthetase GluQRS [Arcanobacterium haemolyticum]|nr:tRNA glutamyl-Q(34) synthetase GluQRS [Arcanobacterium haemolyticum]
MAPMYGRYAPSPTGDLHLGNLRTALLAWALARNSGRGFLMRMEDLDERSRPEFVDSQLADLEALGITWDGEVLFQSDRVAEYDDAIHELEARGALYECYCTRRELANVTSAPHRPPGSYPGTCRELSVQEREAGRLKLAGTNRGPALRLAAPRTDAGELITLSCDDEICGHYEGGVDDLVVRRGDGVFSYNFVSVYDDGVTGVSQVVRGNDLLSSTPRQIFLQQALGLPEPEYAHVPMVFNAEGIRLAKRDGAVTMRELAHYGWTPGDVVDLLGRSLGFAGARNADEFASGLRECVIGVDPWRVDPETLTAGPAAVLA